VRLTLLAVILFLALTLANAMLMRSTQQFVAGHDYAPFQLTQHNAAHYEWDEFIAREVLAAAFTALLYGVVAGLGTRRTARRTAHQPFWKHIANRRR
jgi:hypothetical protein